MAASAPGKLFEDSREPLERMKRYPLRQLAIKAELRPHEDATKDELIALLKASKVDPMDPKWGVRWYREEQTGPTGETYVELYPFRPPSGSERAGIDSQGQLEQRLAKQERKAKKEVEAKDEQIAELTKTVQVMQEMLVRIEQRESERLPSLPLEKALPWQLIQMCKDLGIEYKGSDGKVLDSDELRAAIIGQKSSQRSQ